VLRKLHVAHYVGAQRSGVVRERGTTKARMEFFGNGCATHLGTAFEHQRFESTFGEIEGCDQTVMSAADDNHIARFGHGPMPPRLSGFRAPPDVRERP
jgi:hypothetical protein